MRDLRTRLERLEERDPIEGQPVYVFGSTGAELERKINDATVQHPGRPLIGIRWQDIDEEEA